MEYDDKLNFHCHVNSLILITIINNYYTTLLKSAQKTGKTSTIIQRYSNSWLFVHLVICIVGNQFGKLTCAKNILNEKNKKKWMTFGQRLRPMMNKTGFEVRSLKTCSAVLTT